MSKEQWTHANTCVYNIGYHLIWCPKYRRKVLQAHIADRLKELLNHKAEELDIKIAICEVMPDNVHVFVKCRPTASPHWIVQQLKGYTSRIMRQEFEPLEPDFRRYGHAVIIARVAVIFRKMWLRSILRIRRGIEMLLTYKFRHNRDFRHRVSASF